MQIPHFNQEQQNDKWKEQDGYHLHLHFPPELANISLFTPRYDLTRLSRDICLFAFCNNYYYWSAISHPYHVVKGTKRKENPATAARVITGFIWQGQSTRSGRVNLAKGDHAPRFGSFRPLSGEHLSSELQLAEKQRKAVGGGRLNFSDGKEKKSVQKRAHCLALLLLCSWPLLEPETCFFFFLVQFNVS